VLTDQALDVVVFEIGGQHYGLPVADVRELLPAVSVTPLPGAPAVVEGVINLRGRVVPVLDFRRRFELPPRPPRPADHLIVARAREQFVAVRADRAVDVLRLEADDLAEGRGLIPGVEALGAVARVGDRLVFIHDLHTFLTEGESAALLDAMQERPGGTP
jgi:purine-binding chemotaxis protein CheW